MNRMQGEQGCGKPCKCRIQAFQDLPDEDDIQSVKQDVHQMESRSKQSPDMIFDPEGGVNKGPVVRLAGDGGRIQPDRFQSPDVGQERILRQRVVIPHKSRIYCRKVGKKNQDK